MNILLAVTGSISAYKTFDIARSFVNQGHLVRIILSPGALEFVKPQVYLYLGVEKVYLSNDDFKFPSSEDHLPGTVLHVELCKWADRFIVAPASANTLSKFAQGYAADLLTSIYLAFPKEKPAIIFPAMNNKMLTHPATLENIKSIQKNSNVIIHGTLNGKLACGDEGEGKLLPVENIVTASLYSNPFISKKAKKVMITTGATVCPLDPVRYLTNSSSGITGLHFAELALSKGMQVELICGIYATEKINYLDGLPGINITRVKTPFDMEKIVFHLLNDCHYFISAAAVSDFVFRPSQNKIKKKNLTDTLAISPAPDILEQVIKKKTKNLKIVGFAAETDPSDKVILEKYMRKPVDLLVGTLANNGLLGKKLEGFNQDSATYKIFKKKKNIFQGILSKKDLSEFIFKELE